VSRLRAKCPDCKTYTAVALGPEYECHSWLELPYPETAIIEAETLEEQNLALAADLPERPLILGGCCCSHIGAVEGLAARQDRLSVIWFDAHGDLNTVESSPSGNLWATPLRRLIDSGAIEPEDVALVGARNLDPPEEEFIAASGISRALGDLPERIYVALDGDVIEPGELDVFMPEPAGISLDHLEGLLASIPAPAGAGFTGLVASARNEAALVRLGLALGL